MKQNATGLSNICILATCLLVTLSSTVCLFLGEEDILREQFPRDVTTSCLVTDEKNGLELKQAANEHAQQYGVSIENSLGFFQYSFPAERNGEELNAKNFFDKNTIEVYTLLQEDYNAITGSKYSLAPGEVLLASDSSIKWKQNITLQGTEYRIKENVANPDVIYKIGMAKATVVILPNYSDMEQLQERVNLSMDRNPFSMAYSYLYDVSGEIPEAYYEDMWNEIHDKGVDGLFQAQAQESARTEFFQLYGSIFFVGIFFVVLFLIAAVLIIYYKQITEGFEDHDRFRIMKNVGMSDREVRSTISKQVLMVFFLPLGMAILHIAVAFPVLCKLLMGFGMTNRTLFGLCTLGAVLMFALVYFVVYQLTSKTYYRIVQAKNI